MLPELKSLLYSLLLNHSLDLFLQANMDSLDLCSGGGVVDEEEVRYGDLSSARSWLGSPPFSGSAALAPHSSAWKGRVGAQAWN
jgi:hypothetical protein